MSNPMREEFGIDVYLRVWSDFFTKNLKIIG